MFRIIYDVFFFHPLITFLIIGWAVLIIYKLGKKLASRNGSLQIRLGIGKWIWMLTKQSDNRYHIIRIHKKGTCRSG